MPPDASDTRQKLLDAAARAFAEDGIFNASLIEITRKAGQRNRGALHYLRRVYSQPRTPGGVP